MEESRRKSSGRGIRSEAGSDGTRILVVQDSSQAAERLGQPLGRAGWTVLSAASVAEARPILFGPKRESVDLALVGVGLPNGDARELCREIRAGGGPLVILFGDRADEGALINGLQLGADDYISEPIGTAELLARVNAALRRAAYAARARPERRVVGPLTVDPATRTVAIAGEVIAVTRREYAVLLALVHREGEVVTRDELLATVWGPGWHGTSKVLDVQLSGLRRKLASGPANPHLIRTVRGVGFVLAPPDDRDD